MPETTLLISDNHWKIRTLERVQPGGIVGTPTQPDRVPFGLERDEQDAAQERPDEDRT